MRWYMLLAFPFCVLALAGASDNSTPAQTVQNLFDAMAAHDGSAAHALFTPEANLISVGADGKVTTTPNGKWVERLGSSKDSWLERMWNPKIQEHGAIATVWAEYDFHLNGKFSHCGIDSFSLVKADAGWKISEIAFTRETSGCAPSPLGPPAGTQNHDLQAGPATRKRR